MKEPDAESFRKKLWDLLTEANRDLIKCNELRDYLDENAELLQQTCHTVAYKIERELVNRVAGMNDGLELKGWGRGEMIHREYKNVLAGLLEDDSNFMIRLLAERAALCWLHIQAAESDRNQLRYCTGVQHYHIERAEKQITMAQNRFLRACAALTKARAMILATEAMQEKIGKRPKPQLALVSGQ